VKLTALDWAVVALYFLVNLLIGFYYRSRASKDVSEFFLSGRNVPWWLAGTSMVATTFAADTPLAVTELVANGGVAGNWLWWNMVAGNMLTVFFFARLWRRSGVMTDIEFSEIRYSGRPAALLRGFRAIYLGLPINCIVLGWVNLAMVTIFELVLGVDKQTALLYTMGLSLFTAVISTLSGLWGVLVTDTFQFVVKMGMVIVLAVCAVQAVGGMDQLLVKLQAVDLARQAATGQKGSILDMLPDPSSAYLPFLAFLTYISLNWWASWYPGAEPGGGGYVAQRMFSAKDERHSLLATLWFNIAHFTIRTWPWVLTALCCVVLYPNLQNPREGYVRVMMDHLPPYLRGTMVAAFIAAYMSTVATQLNWGASYLVNDLYKRFIAPQAEGKQLVVASQVATVLIMIVSAIVTSYMESISGAWQLLIGLGAGTGGVLLMRWYWWRVNAWSEISAMATALVVSMVIHFGGFFASEGNGEIVNAKRLIATTLITTIVWLITTFITKPEPMETLKAFYRTTHPSLTGWTPVAKLVPDVQAVNDLGSNLLCWLAGCGLIYGMLFGVGKILFQEVALGASLCAVGAACGWFIYWSLSRRGWATISK
jgi:solute:Na+ symporter, SSS family